MFVEIDVAGCNFVVHAMLCEITEVLILFLLSGGLIDCGSVDTVSVG